MRSKGRSVGHAVYIRLQLLDLISYLSLRYSNGLLDRRPASNGLRLSA